MIYQWETWKMSRILTAHNLARYSAIHVGSRWKIQDRRQIKNTDNTELNTTWKKANNAKHSKTKLPWFSRL